MGRFLVHHLLSPINSMATRPQHTDPTPCCPTVSLCATNFLFICHLGVQGLSIHWTVPSHSPFGHRNGSIAVRQWWVATGQSVARSTKPRILNTPDTISWQAIPFQQRRIRRVPPPGNNNVIERISGCGCGLLPPSIRPEQWHRHVCAEIA